MHTGKRGSYHGCVKAFYDDLIEMEDIYEMDIRNNLTSN